MNTIKYHGFELDSDPSAIPVYDEVIGRDCYRVDTIPQDIEHIIDIGAFHGEFMLWAHKHRPKAALHGYEPNPDSHFKALRNLWNGIEPKRIWSLIPEAVGAHHGLCSVEVPDGHPAGSVIVHDKEGDVDVVSIDFVVAGKRNIAIKMDCEGSERAIFSRLDWLENVRWIAMEFHDYDGQYFARLLINAGFIVGHLEGCQGDPWEPTMAGGIIIAWRPV